MKHRDLQEAFPAVPERFEKRIHTTMMHMEDQSMKTKHKVKLSLVVALVLITVDGRGACRRHAVGRSGFSYVQG